MTDFLALKAKVDFSEVDKAKDAFSKLKNEIPGASDAIDTFGDVAKALENPLLAVATALAAATAGAIGLGFRAIELADKMNDLGTRTGKSIEYLQTLSDVAEKSGSNLDTMTDVLDMIQKKSVAGGEEGKKTGKAYEFLGISARDASGHLKDAAVLGQEGAEALERLGHSADATAAFQDAFGASALKVLPTLKDLNTEIDKQYDFLASVGALMDSNLTTAADNYNDKLHDLGSIFKGLGNDIARMMLPMLTGMADAMIHSATNSGVLNIALEGVKAAVWLVVSALKGVLTFFVAFDNGLSNIVQSIVLAGKVIWAAMTGKIDEVPKLWEDYKTRIVKTNIDAAADIEKIWGNVDAAPQSKDEFKKTKIKPGKTYDPYAKPTEPPKPEKSPYIDMLLAEDKAIAKLAQEYGSFYGLQKQSHAAVMEATLASEKYNDKLNDEQRATLKAKAALQDQLEALIGVTKAQKAADAAIEKAIESSKDEIAINRIRLAIKKDLTKTTDDERIAVAKYNVTQAQEALDAAKAAKAEETKLIKLREELAIRKQLLNTAEQVGADNKDAEAKTFADGWTNAFEQYKKSATDAAKIGGDAFGKTTDLLTDSITTFVETGKLGFKDFLAGFLKMIEGILIKWAVLNALSYAFGGGPVPLSAMFATKQEKGGAWSGGMQMFADGGVVTGPTPFGMSGGKMGLMGEAGPEAIMPLKRGSDGKLGVAMSGGSSGGVQVNNQISVSIGSVDSDERQQELMRTIKDTIKATTKQEMANQMRPGGMLARRATA